MTSSSSRLIGTVRVGGGRHDNGQVVVVTYGSDRCRAPAHAWWSLVPAGWGGSEWDGVVVSGMDREITVVLRFLNSRQDGFQLADG